RCIAVVENIAKAVTLVVVARAAVLRIKAGDAILGTEPKIAEIILHNARNSTITQTLLKAVGGELTCISIHQIQTATVSPHPKSALAVFVTSEHKIGRETFGVGRVMGVARELAGCAIK